VNILLREYCSDSICKAFFRIKSKEAIIMQPTWTNALCAGKLPFRILIIKADIYLFENHDETMQIFKKLSTQSIHRKKVTLFNAQRL
jgi:hypothetical protein